MLESLVAENYARLKFLKMMSQYQMHYFFDFAKDSLACMALILSLQTFICTATLPRASKILAHCIRFGCSHLNDIMESWGIITILWSNRSVEVQLMKVQLMRRFLRAGCSFVQRLFKDLLQRDDGEKVGNLIASVKYSRCCLPQEEVDCLIQFYQKMYPELSQRLKDGMIYVPSIIKKFSSLERNGKRIDSDHNHNAKNYFVIAEPPFNFTTMQSSS